MIKFDQHRASSQIARLTRHFTDVIVTVRLDCDADGENGMRQGLRCFAALRMTA